MGSSSCSAGTLSAPVRNSSPRLHLLKTNLMSKADFKAFELLEDLVGEALGLQGRRG